MSGARVFGAINVYADRPAAFASAEIELPGELAGDLTHGLQGIEDESEAIHIDTADAEILAVNPRMSDLLGYSREELLRMHIAELSAPAAKPAGRVIIAQFAQHGSAVFESLNLHKDGRRIPVEISIGQIKRPSGDLYVSIVRDVTERKQAEARIRQQLVELQRWYDVTLNRETRTLELKHAVNALLRRLSEPIRYPSAE